MFCVYVLKCRDGSFYTGYTNDLAARLKMHNEGNASKYTRSRLPVRIVAKWVFNTKSEAVKNEAAFKQLPRKSKLKEITKQINRTNQPF